MLTYYVSLVHVLEVDYGDPVSSVLERFHLLPWETDRDIMRQVIVGLVEELSREWVDDSAERLGFYTWDEILEA